MNKCYYYPFSQLGKNESSSDIKLVEQFDKNPNSSIVSSVNVMQQKSEDQLEDELSNQLSTETFLEAEESDEQTEPEEQAEPQEFNKPPDSHKLHKSHKSKDFINIYNYNKPARIIKPPSAILNISNPNKFSGLIFLCLLVILLVLILISK